jgi:choline kinase
MLDARVPPGGWKEEEKRREEVAEGRVRELLEETRLWRPANSAQWVAWGIVQAKLPELAEKIAREREENEKKIGSTVANDSAAGDGTTAPVSPAGEAHADGQEAVSDADAAAANIAAAVAAQEEESGEADEFDYLGYTRERALFFLGDCVLMGLLKLEDLPEGIREQLKLVDY